MYNVDNIYRLSYDNFLVFRLGVGESAAAQAKHQKND